ncbi:MAG: hypothetical protein PHP35_02805 [Candidatus Colwellbacteria bacterium]|nr:hypothetical protein [Candidatus Colwellbacteria bacterium]
MKAASSFRRNLLYRRLVIIASATIAIAVVVGAVFLVCRYSGFRISSIVVSGNRSVSSEEIIAVSRETANSCFWGKLLGNDHLFAWMSFPKEKLTEAIFRLRDAAIDIGENREINISVTERKETASWCLVIEEKKRCFWMDEEGALFAPGPDAEGSLVRVINDRTGRDMGIKDRPLSVEEMANFQKTSLMISELSLPISDISLNQSGSKDLTIKLFSGHEIRFSLSTDPSFGVPVIRSLIESGEWPRVEYLDLRIEGKGFYKLK